MDTHRAHPLRTTLPRSGRSGVSRLGNGLVGSEQVQLRPVRVDDAPFPARGSEGCHPQGGEEGVLAGGQPPDDFVAGPAAAVNPLRSRPKDPKQLNSSRQRIASRPSAIPHSCASDDWKQKKARIALWMPIRADRRLPWTIWLRTL